MVNERNLDAYSNNLAHLLMCDCCDLRMRSIGFQKGQRDTCRVYTRVRVC